MKKIYQGMIKVQNIMCAWCIHVLILNYVYTDMMYTSKGCFLKKGSLLIVTGLP